MENTDNLSEFISATDLEQQCKEYVNFYAEHQTSKDSLKKELDDLKEKEKINTEPENDGEKLIKHLKSKKTEMQEKTGKTIIAGLVALIFLVAFTFLFKILGIFENLAYTNQFWKGQLGVWIVRGVVLSWLAIVIVLIFTMKEGYRARAKLEKSKNGLLVGIVVLIFLIAGGYFYVSGKWNIGYSVPVQGGSLGKSSEWGFALVIALILALLPALAVFFCISKENQTLKIMVLLQTFEDMIEKKLSEKLRGYDVDIKKVENYCKVKKEEEVILEKWKNVRKIVENRIGLNGEAIRRAAEETPKMPDTIYIANWEDEKEINKIEEIKYQHESLVFLYDSPEDEDEKNVKRQKIVKKKKNANKKASELLGELLPKFIWSEILSFSAFNRGNLNIHVMDYYGVDKSLERLRQEEAKNFELYFGDEECTKCLDKLQEKVKENESKTQKEECDSVEVFNEKHKDKMLSYQLVNIILKPSDDSYLKEIEKRPQIHQNSYKSGILLVYFVAKQDWEKKKEYANKMETSNVWYLNEQEGKLELEKYEK